MRLHTLSLILALGACAASTPPAAAPQPAPQAAATTAPKGLQIKLSTVYVDDQDKALRFYTEVLGFAKKDDVSNGGYRWLTVAAANNPDGGQLQLAPDTNPAAKAYKDALFTNNQPAIMLFTDDIQGDVERIKAHGGELTMPPTDVTYATIAMVKDTCGNLVQISQLER
jgi:predicted enzyme related to lactoylglutathione lyase